MTRPEPAAGLARSRALFERAGHVLVGGVNSPVRAYRSVGGTPPFLVRAHGARVWDADGNAYVDHVNGYGPLILGHAHPDVVAAVTAAAADGLCFGAPTEAEARLGERVRERMPALERVRLVTSGTEAAMSALRLARAATGRTHVVKFDGAYHGHADPFLTRAGSGLATLGVPTSPGVPAGVAADVHTVPYNDAAGVETVLKAHRDQVAAVFVEPVAANMGVVPPAPDFLPRLRELCDAHGVLFVFDEVVTGFRVAPGGAQQRYRVRPDLTLLGKVLGGGLPLAAFGGRADLMDQVAPVGPVYQAGTLSGNPVAVAAGLATLDRLDEAAYAALERAGARLEEGIRTAAADAQVPAVVNRVASLLTVFHTAGPVTDFETAAAADAGRHARVHHRLLAAGVHAPPSPYEAMFLSTAHEPADLSHSIDAFARALAPERAEVAA